MQTCTCYHTAGGKQIVPGEGLCLNLMSSLFIRKRWKYLIVQYQVELGERLCGIAEDESFVLER